MSTLKERAQARKPKATPTAEIPSIPEVDVTLYAAANETRRNQFRGRLDSAGTVRVRVYAPGDAKKLSGEVLAGTVEDETDVEVLEIKGSEIVKVEYRDTLAPNTLVILWAPAEADIEGVRMAL